VPGALAATLGFVLPAFVLVTALSAAYFAGGELPWVHKLFLGLEALVIGVLANDTLNLGQQAIKGASSYLLLWWLSSPCCSRSTRSSSRWWRWAWVPWPFPDRALPQARRCC
jgi:hypothetical protein